MIDRSSPVRHRVVSRLAVALAVLVSVMASTTTAASAHTGPGVHEETVGNYHYEVVDFAPPEPGIGLRVVLATHELELTNPTSRTVVVMGYTGEPYLRVGPDGVFTNTRSPATYLNTTMEGGVEAPPEADPDAEPVWQRTSAGTTARWHDHRAHWMAPTPRLALDEPDSKHLLDEWTIEMTVDDVVVLAHGETTWVPGPATWPWVLLAVVLALAVLAAAWWRSRALIAVAAVVLLAAATVDVLGVWWASDDAWTSKAAALDVAGLAALFVIAGVVYLPRRPRDATGLIAAGAIGIAVVFGAVSWRYLTASQLPTDLPADLARATVAVSLGLGVGLALVPAVWWFRDPHRRRTRALARKVAGDAPA